MFKMTRKQTALAEERESRPKPKRPRKKPPVPSEEATLNYLNANPDATARDIARESGIGVQTVMKTLGNLEALGLIRYTGERPEN